jgi:hypothetical protein
VGQTEREGEGVKTDQTESSPIKPNQTKSNLPEGQMDLPEAKMDVPEGNEGGGMKAFQTQSNPVKPEREV